MSKILDPRTKLLLLILAALYISLSMSSTGEFLLIVIYISPFLMAGLYKWALAFLAVYFIQILISLYVLPHIEWSFIIFIVSFLAFGMRMLLPSIIAGVYSMKTTSVSEWIAAFKKIRMPNWLLIPLAVMARFFPTIKKDYQSIRKAMAFRGIGSDFWDLVKHPVQTLEYILIPLLMNATQVAEDLTISSLTKGLSLPGKHTSIVQLRMGLYDWFLILLALLPMILHLGGII